MEWFQLTLHGLITVRNTNMWGQLEVVVTTNILIFSASQKLSLNGHLSLLTFSSDQSIVLVGPVAKGYTYDNLAPLKLPSQHLFCVY